MTSPTIKVTANDETKVLARTIEERFCQHGLVVLDTDTPNEFNTAAKAATIAAGALLAKGVVLAIQPEFRDDDDTRYNDRNRLRTTLLNRP